MPSTHSEVRTSFSVRSQSTAGTRKSLSPGDILGKFGGGRRFEAEIHLHLHRAGENIDHLDRLQPFGIGEASVRRSAPRNTYRTGRGGNAARCPAAALSPRHRARPAHPGRGRDALARSRRRPPARPKATKTSPSFRAEGRLDHLRPPRRCGKGGMRSCRSSSRRATSAPTTSGPRREKLAELHVRWAEPADRRRQKTPAPSSSACRAIWRGRSGSRATGGKAAISTSRNRPARESTKPARAMRRGCPRERSR